MLKELSEGDKIEFKEILLLSEEQTGKRPSTYASQILDFDKDDDNVISVSMPVSKGHLVPLPKGSVFDTYFYTEKGLYRCKCRILDRIKTDNIYSINISMETELKKFQRRQYFRLEKTIPIIYTELSDKEFTALLETKKLSEDFLHAERYAEGTCLDISGGGMRFVGSKMIETGWKLILIFQIVVGGKEIKFRLPATVRMSFSLPNDSTKYEHRVEFENISKEYREILIKYIFEEERMMRKSAK